MLLLWGVFGWISPKEKVSLWFLCMFLFSVFLMLMNFGVWFYQREPRFQSNRVGESGRTNFRNKYKKPNKEDSVKAYLYRRYGFFWRSKIHLVLVTGDEAAIEQLVPSLQESQWLEGDRTVLIHGGSLSPRRKVKNMSLCVNCAVVGRWMELSG